MAYDPGLAERLRALLDDAPGVSEKEMFGGLAFLHEGRMFCGVLGEELMVRVGPDGHAAALAEHHVRPMDFTGRPMVGYVYVAPPALRDDEGLERWARRGMDFVATLPAKPAATKKAAKKPR